MTSIKINIIDQSPKLIRLYKRSSEQDKVHLEKAIHEMNDRGQSILMIRDHQYRSLDFCFAHTIYCDQNKVRPLDFALMITQLIISERFEVFILNGYLPSLYQFLPRLRWVSYHYGVQLILYGEG